MRPSPLSKALQRALIVPAVLAVSSSGPACGGKHDDTTTQTGTGTTAGSTTGTTATATTDVPTTGTTGHELPDCPKYDADAETCSSMIDCIYLINQSACIVRCNNFHDQASCEMQAYCYWEAGGCYLAV